MSELFDKQVNAQKRKPSRFHASSHKPTKRCVMKMKQSNKKKRCVRKNDIDGRNHFIRHIRKTGENDFDELQVNDFGHKGGSIWVNWCQGDDFSSVGAQTGAIKLAVAGT